MNYIRLQKTLKSSLRRCVYRRWEITLKGKSITIKTTALERMYRGNTPYPIKPPKIKFKTYNTTSTAHNMFQHALKFKTRKGYKQI